MDLNIASSGSLKEKFYKQKRIPCESDERCDKQDSISNELSVDSLEENVEISSREVVLNRPVLPELTDTCVTCKFLSEDFFCIPSLQFWKTVAEYGPENGNVCHLKYFKCLMGRLDEIFPKEEGLRSRCTRNLFRVLLKVEGSETAVISLSNYKFLIQLFGSIQTKDGAKSILIQKLYQLVTESMKRRNHERRKISWFVGHMTRDKSEEMLSHPDVQDKTFMIRISNTDGGDFVLSVKHENHCHHLKIERAIDAHNEDYNPHLIFHDMTYESLPAVVRHIITKGEVTIKSEDEACNRIPCMRVFPKSPLNGVIVGYE